MRSLVVILALLGAVCAVEYYDKKFDNLNIQEVITNERSLKQYVKCFLDKGRCNAMGNDLKGLIKDALETTCKRCSPKQIETLRTLHEFMEQHHASMYNELLQKYDPDLRYRANFKKFLAAHPKRA